MAHHACSKRITIRVSPPDDIDPEFRAAVRQRKFEPDTRLYYFLPTDDPTAFTAYDETLLVTPVGELYGVHVGAC